MVRCSFTMADGYIVLVTVLCLLAVFHLRHPVDTDEESDQSAVEGEIVVKEEFDAAGHRVTEKRPLTVNNLI